MVERLFLAVPRGCLQFVIVVFPDHTHLLFFIYEDGSIWSTLIFIKIIGSDTLLFPLPPSVVLLDTNINMYKTYSYEGLDGV